jgi:hypothetical protein
MSSNFTLLKIKLLESLTYIIFRNNQICETDAETYEHWMETEWPNVKLPDWVFKLGKKRFYIETRFHGALDKSEGPFPFVILYFEDDWLDEAGESILPRDYDETYFGSYEEWKNHYESLIENLTRKEQEYGS